MKTETITRKKLTAADGMILTDGSNYGREIFLAEGADLDVWHEITEAEYEDIMQTADINGMGVQNNENDN